ncbi:MAG: hypothetical protein ACOCRO_04275 [Halanaerobiales bacterium]
MKGLFNKILNKLKGNKTQNKSEKNPKEKFKEIISAKSFLKLLNIVSSKYGKAMEKSSNEMFSDKSTLPYSKQTIIDSLKILMAIMYFNREEKHLENYKGAYDNLSTYHSIDEKTQEEISMFNDLNSMQEINQLMNDKSDETNGISEDQKEGIMEVAKIIAEGDKESYDYYNEVSNKEKEKNNKEFYKFLEEAKQYLKENELNKKYFGNFYNFYDYLIENKPHLIKRLYINISENTTVK